VKCDVHAMLPFHNVGWLIIGANICAVHKERLTLWHTTPRVQLLLCSSPEIIAEISLDIHLGPLYRLARAQADWAW